MIFRRRSQRALIAGRWPSKHRPRPSDSDGGSAAVELVILTPALVLLTVMVVFLGRAGQATGQVSHAADQAARAASQVSAVRMPLTARTAARADLAANGVVCASVAVDTIVSSDMGVPSWVTVTVTCTVEGEGLGLLGVGRRIVRATSTEPVDRYRAP